MKQVLYNKEAEFKIEDREVKYRNLSRPLKFIIWVCCVFCVWFVLAILMALFNPVK
jgi:hypothetical protein